MTTDQAAQLIHSTDSLATAVNLLVQIMPSVLVLAVAALGVWFGQMAGGAVMR